MIVGFMHIIQLFIKVKFRVGQPEWKFQVGPSLKKEGWLSPALNPDGSRVSSKFYKVFKKNKNNTFRSAGPDPNTLSGLKLLSSPA